MLPKGTHFSYNVRVKHFAWDLDKNELLRRERGVSFEEVVFHIENGDILDILDNPNKEKYGHQRIFIIDIEGYAYVVPFVESETELFLKTIIPSRKMTLKYLYDE